MAYQALYRVWRPQQFKDVLGQKIVTQTLCNAVATDQISHAYLFAGPRGTGKTSCAKILAKAVNCLHPQNGEPCNQCDICQAINAGRLTDVIEIDAASNNGVDEIRDIRDKVKYPPTEAHYKVYIIDEVHMLSTGAFNALLKTLEEPPAHVIFILATTELQKVPATIISRTQRFTFRRIDHDTLTRQMQLILKDQQISYDDEALQVISRAAEGGMRDALSILDQVLSFGQDHVSLKNALEVTGDASDDQLADYLSAVFKQDLTPALQEITTLFAQGRSSARLMSGMIEMFRNLLLQQNNPDLLQQLDYRPLPEALLPYSKQVSADQLYTLIDLVNQALQQLKTSAHGDLLLEVLTVKLITQLKQTQTKTASDDDSAAVIKDLRQQVSQLTTTVQQLQQGTAEKTAPAKTAPAKTKAAMPVKANREQVYQVLKAATKSDLEAVREVWPDLLSKLSPAKRAMMKVSQPVAASPHAIVVAFTYAFTLKTANGNADLRTELKQELNHFMHNEADIILVQKSDWPVLRQDYIKTLRHPAQKVTPKAADKSEKPASDASSTEQSTTPLVKQAEALFGQHIIKIKKD